MTGKWNDLYVMFNLVCSTGFVESHALYHLIKYKPLGIRNIIQVIIQLTP